MLRSPSEYEFRLDNDHGDGDGDDDIINSGLLSAVTIAAPTLPKTKKKSHPEQLLNLWQE